MRAAGCAAIGIALAGCGGATAAIESAPGSTEEVAFAVGEIRVAAEGPCARLSIAAIGARRVLVYGDTGYDLAGWLPDDEVPAEQSLAVLSPRGAGIDGRLLEGLPRDGRGYVAGALELGGSDEADAWLVHMTTRYAPGGKGALFARASTGFRLGPEGWRRSGEATVERPRETARLPELRVDDCGEGGAFVPLASATTRGGVLVAGRCDDARVANPAKATLLVAHGRPGATTWRVHAVPGTENLDGIINVAIDARTDDDAVLTAWEPFLPMDKRRAFAARWRGNSWEPAALDVPGGYVDVAHDPSGGLLLANGRGVYRIDGAGRARRLSLPSPRFARGSLEDIYVHGVRTFDAEIWIEASYRVWPSQGKPAVWASALFTNAKVPRTVHCDAAEPAERALSEVE